MIQALYIDPATTSIVITAATSIVIAVVAAITIAWRKAKKKVAQKLNLDDLSKKESEAEVELVDEDDDI